MLKIVVFAIIAIKFIACDPTEQWYTQFLDHFNDQDQRTWQQRFFVNDTFWNKHLQGPIFFLLGGEGSISGLDVVLLEVVTYAQKYGALVVTAEHRFYGKSKPLPDLSNNNLVYLNSQQALADYAYFIQGFKELYGAKASSVVTFGGSYPGNLCVWFRELYSHLTVGAICSSSPVRAELDFVQYLDVVEQSLDHFTGQECDKRIRQATDQIQGMLQTQDGTQMVAKLFKTCAPLQSSDDISNLMSNLMGNWMGTVQYNNEGGPVTIVSLCNIMNNGTDSLESYVKINDMFLEFQGLKCQDVSYVNMMNLLANTTQPEDGVGMRSWTYQTCAEFGYFQSTDSKNQPFGNLVPLGWYLKQCIQLFNMLPRINETNIRYGGKHPGGSNILFINGLIDPWSSLSVTKAVEDRIAVVVIPDTAHCADFFPAKDPNSELGKAQTKIANIIGKYLSQ